MMLQSSPESDTALARLLHAQGAIDLKVLQRLLNEVRAQRQSGRSSSLAHSLVNAGMLSPEEVQRFVGELQAPPALHASGVGQADWRPGGRVGDYRIEKLLGRGAMGQVYLAEHIHTGARHALKTLALQADSELILRFEREGQAQAAVGAHPNVVGVHSAGRAGESLYLAMDLAEGGDLEKRLRMGPLDPEEAARLALGLAEGLAHVHRHGILHRDLKAANVLFNAEGTPMLVDFGLARIQGGTALTQTSELLGTPACMAPEQAQSLHDQVDERTDVYGLGAVLFHMLTGRPPFVGSTAIEVLSKAILDEVPVPSHLAEGIPRAMDAISLRALAKEQDARYPGADAMAADLRAFLGDAEASGLEDGGGSGGAGLLAVLTLSILLLLGLGGWALSRSGSDAPAALGETPTGAAPLGSGALSRSRPATPNSTPAPAPAPEPAVARAQGIWQPEPGRLLRCEFEIRGETQPALGPLRKHSIVMGLTLKALRHGSERIELAMNLEEVRFSYDIPGGLGTGIFDSQQERDPDHRGAALLRREFLLDLDAWTGQALRVEGFRHPTGLLNELNVLLCIGPPRGHDPGQPWEREEQILQFASGGWPGMQDTFVPEVIAPESEGAAVEFVRRDGEVCRFEAEPLEGDGLRIRWGGERPYWELSGEAEFHGGFLRSARAQRTWRAPDGAYGTNRYRFAVRGRR